MEGVGRESRAVQVPITNQLDATAQNTNRRPLTDPTGHHIRYGTSSGDCTQTIAIDNPEIATYVVSDLAPGTHCFSVVAVNSSGTGDSAGLSSRCDGDRSPTRAFSSIVPAPAQRPKLALAALH